MISGRICRSRDRMPNSPSGCGSWRAPRSDSTRGDAPSSTTQPGKKPGRSTRHPARHSEIVTEIDRRAGHVLAGRVQFDLEALPGDHVARRSDGKLRAVAIAAEVQLDDMLEPTGVGMARAFRKQTRPLHIRQMPEVSQHTMNQPGGPAA